MSKSALRTAKFLRSKRTALGLTQEQFARLFNVDRPTISRYESAKVQAPGGLILQVLEVANRMGEGGQMINKSTVVDFFGSDFRLFYGHYFPDIRKASADEFKAICPFHSEENPSFNFNASTGQFFCHGCSAKGDIFSFYSRFHGINGDFPGVLKGIASDFGIEDANPASPRKKIKSFRPFVHPKLGRATEKYAYTDEDDAVFRKSRSC